MVPVIKGLAVLRGHNIRRSANFHTCPLSSSKKYLAGSSIYFYIKSRLSHRFVGDATLRCSSASNASDVNLKSKDAGGIQRAGMGGEKQTAAVDTSVANALLDFINASWTPYHAVGTGQ